MNKITIQHVPFHPTLTPKQPVKETQSKTSFLEHLQEAKQQELKISRHASERMQERNIEISKDEWQHVTSKVMEARDKGVKQPLVLLDQAALIVSAKNATVITAMDRQEAKSQLFTNIDGTIVL
ncbi:TIGR02530 family flagellar biosynthesis protein [Lysinibacillus sp. 3P01SB]|uniref:TIGR02530 family flagellar biosynthesis protein n=1 Tax=Lysinibacillus sp. 3P01SB TaxID=3132284 RepID=UPI0039A64A56